MLWSLWYIYADSNVNACYNIQYVCTSYNIHYSRVRIEVILQVMIIGQLVLSCWVWKKVSHVNLLQHCNSIANWLLYFRIYNNAIIEISKLFGKNIITNLKVITTGCLECGVVERKLRVQTSGVGASDETLAVQVQGMQVQIHVQFVHIDDCLIELHAVVGVFHDIRHIATK